MHRTNLIPIIPALVISLISCRHADQEPVEHPFNVVHVDSVRFLEQKVPLPRQADLLTRRPAVRIDSLPDQLTPSAPGSRIVYSTPRSRIVFADSTTLTVPLAVARLQTSLPSDGGAEWLLVSGFECNSCDADPLIVVVRAAPGVTTRLGLAFPYPGTLLMDFEDPKPYFRSRFFIGRCVDEKTPVAVWLEEPLEGPDRRRTVRILRSMPRLSDITLPWTDAMTRHLEERVQAGVCREVTEPAFPK